MGGGVRHLRLACVVAGLIVAGTACSTTTAGSGQEVTPASTGSSSPDFPSETSSPPSASASATSSTPAAVLPPRPSRAELATRLATLTPGQQDVIVAVPAGYEAMSFDQSAHIAFWKYTSVDWTRAAASSYPYSSAVGGPADAHAIGTLLAGMRDATFIVTGNFSGDGSGNAVAYTTGALGWGAIKAEPNGRIGPSGQPVGSDKIGLSYGFAFVGGRLETEDCPLNQPLADCGANPVVKTWAWNGTDFSRV
jgi:hypothetical protein